jgi:cysteinyl-tRNA synthetase
MSLLSFMVLQFYNTRTRKKEEFKPLKEGHVGLYVCGPTVYNFAHIGNFRAMVAGDILKRYLLYKKFHVLHVMNITDVDDKIIRDSQKTREHWRPFTERYTKAFFDDMEILHMHKADHYPKATDHVEEMIAMIKTLLDKGIAYKADDGIYFSVAKFEGYGKFARLSLEGMETGKRILTDEYDKETVNDFALWKYWKEDDGAVTWETPLGKGRPGWHIECSAMSTKYFGAQFDIHTGGIDLVFPHHQNEIAQTEGCTGKHPFVNVWLHNEHILVDGKKMSKSLGNFYTLRDLLDKGYKPMAIRYVLLSSNYRQQLNFTLKGLNGAASAVQRYQEFYDRMKKIEGDAPDNPDVEILIADATQKFEDAMNNDLETSPALAAVFDFMHTVNKLVDSHGLDRDDAAKVVLFIEEIDTVLGLLVAEEVIPADILYLAQQREEARKAKNWAKSDSLRDELKEKRYRIDDTKDGFVVKKV